MKLSDEKSKVLLDLILSMKRKSKPNLMEFYDAKDDTKGLWPKYCQFIDYLNYSKEARERKVLKEGELPSDIYIHPLMAKFIYPYWLSATGDKDSNNLIKRYDDLVECPDITVDDIHKVNNVLDSLFGTKTTHLRLDDIRGVKTFDASKPELYNWDEHDKKFYLCGDGKGDKIPEDNGKLVPKYGDSVHSHLNHTEWPIPIYAPVAHLLWSEQIHEWNTSLNEKSHISKRFEKTIEGVFSL